MIGEVRAAIGVCLVGLAACASVQAQSLVAPTPPEIGASSYVLLDFATGKTLAASHADERVDPASLTKLMTAYVVFQALRAGQISLDDQVLVSEKAWRTRGSRMFIEVDTRVGVEDLLQGMIVQSGNDASVALAEHVAGTVGDFVGLMNVQAAALGMTGTLYQNSTGLPARNHYSTAADTGRLARALMEEFPEHYYRYSQREFTYNDIKQHNRNSLLWLDPSVDGLKTGYTAAAGYCLVSSAKRGELRLIGVVMGMPDYKARASGTQALLDYGFGSFERHKLYAAGQEITTARVLKGDPVNVELGLAEDLYVTIAQGQLPELGASTELPAQISAPLAAGVPVGSLQISLHGEILATAPLLTLNQVALGSLWLRIKDEFAVWRD